MKYYTKKLYAEYLMTQERTPEAKNNLLRTLPLLAKTAQPKPQAETYTLLVKLHLQENNATLALRYTDSALTILPQNAFYELANTYKIKALALNALGNYAAAFIAEKRVYHLDSTRLNRQRFAYIDGVMTDQQVKEKEEKLAEAQTQVAYQRTRNIALLLIVALLGASLVLLYRQYQWQRKALSAEAKRAAILESNLLANELAMETLQSENEQLKQTPALFDAPVTAPETQAPTSLTLSDKTILPFADILYLKSDDNYVDIMTVQGKKYLERITLKKLSELLPPETFGRVHRSYILNYNYITDQRYDFFLLTDGTKIPKSKAK